MSYRVFPANSRNASNFAIAKAIDRAVEHGCDLINMSLGGGDPDSAISSAIADARAAGVAVLVAAGNDSRAAVCFPAADPRAVAVSAMGRTGTFPKSSTETFDIVAPYGKDKRDFAARFTNIGREIDVMGPGVGIVSTVPGGYVSLSGTSMACPAITGFAARLLGKQTKLLESTRDQTRSDEIIKLILSAAESLGFAAEFEGVGMPQ